MLNKKFQQGEVVSLTAAIITAAVALIVMLTSYAKNLKKEHDDFVAQDKAARFIKLVNNTEYEVSALIQLGEAANYNTILRPQQKITVPAWVSQNKLKRGSIVKPIFTVAFDSTKNEVITENYSQDITCSGQPLGPGFIGFAVNVANSNTPMCTFTGS